ncbi:MAG: thioredoxin [Salaquimonas sp.]|jgi:putative thioredoxin|nr:thioredoxin [Salaquimonas sp.]
MSSTGNGSVDFLGTLGDGGPASSGGGAPEAVKDISTAEFMVEVIEASNERPVLVDFWAPWCGPCKQLGPVLEKVVAESRGKVKLVKMNIDQHPEIAGQMGVQSIPAVVAFDQGKPKDAFMGAVPESEVRRFIDKLAGPSGPSPIDQALEEAARLEGEGAHAEAANLYASVLQQEPHNVAALAGMGTLYLTSGDAERARAMYEAIPADQHGKPEAASLKAAIDLAEQAASLGDTAELLARIEADPKDYHARFDLALALNAKGRREEAADQLLEIIRRDRKWNDDGARAQLLQFFEAWGPTDEATLSARRQLSSILFS